MFNLADTIEAAFPWRLPVWLTSYHQEVTPLSTWPSVMTAIIVYLSTIFGLREIMRERQALKLTFLFQLHNLLLTSGSALLLAVMLEEILPIVWNHGIFYAICGYGAWTPRLEFFYIINYYFKYVELIDTVFLALKKKPLAFLHVFHHSATAVLCFTQLNGRTSVSWVVITLNLAVHVLMYYYYWATAGGRKIWWKKYLTTMQITQFVIDLFIVYFASYSYFASTYWPHLPTVGTCAGEEHAALFGCGLLTSYLFLFIDFYIRTYKGGKGAAKKGAVADKATNGHIANGNGKAH
jgi:fatty acid elongase 3